MASFDHAALAAEYERQRPLRESLRQEVEFALEQELAQARLKTHSVRGRVKELDSLLEKAERRSYGDPIRDAKDLVGIRVVVLFLNDLDRVQAIANRLFDIFDCDDKVAPSDPEREDRFGYMSVHLLGRLRHDHAGPRYDALKGMEFELQIRTVVMDAWANVSHYLGYKSPAAIPQELRRDFYALSGLFYVADSHFELFSRQSMRSQRAAVQTVNKARDVSGAGHKIPVNADTLKALLDGFYSDRVKLSREDASQLVDEVLRADYATVGRLQAALIRGRPGFVEYERKHPPYPGTRFAAMGAARISLAIADPSYGRLLYGDEDFSLYRRRRSR